MATVSMKSVVIESQLAALIKSLAEKHLFWGEKKEGELSGRGGEKGMMGEKRMKRREKEERRAG